VKIEHNIQRVRKSVADEQGRYVIRTKVAAKRLGRMMRDNIRDNVRPKIAGGVFPGYAMTGRLRRSVMAGESVKKGKRWVATVQVQQRGVVKKYALIHEKGGVIQAKNKPFLVFRTRIGKEWQWVRVKQVRITAKHYFRDGVQKTRREATLSKLQRMW